MEGGVEATGDLVMSSAGGRYGMCWLCSCIR